LQTFQVRFFCKVDIARRGTSVIAELLLFIKNRACGVAL